MAGLAMLSCMGLAWARAAPEASAPRVKAVMARGRALMEKLLGGGKPRRTARCLLLRHRGPAGYRAAQSARTFIPADAVTGALHEPNNRRESRANERCRSGAARAVRPWPGRRRRGLPHLPPETRGAPAGLSRPPPVRVAR